MACFGHYAIGDQKTIDTKGKKRLRGWLIPSFGDLFRALELA